MGVNFLSPSIFDDPNQMLGKPGEIIVAPTHKGGELLSDKFSMPPGHKTMIASVKKLPDHATPIHYQPQQQNLQEQKKTWMWIGTRIDFLQVVQLGFLPNDSPLDPCKDISLHPAQSNHIDVASSYFVSILNLLIGNPRAKISGFLLTKKAAAHEGKEFPFTNPRELFAQICREFADSPIGNEISSEEPNNLTELRLNFRQQSAFYRKRLPDEETKAILEECRNSNTWSDFLTFAVWEKTERDRAIKPFWKEFLAAHKEITKFICDKKDKDGVRLVVPEERPTGRRVDPKTRQVLNCKVL